jgi:hypothetical protein
VICKKKTPFIRTPKRGDQKNIQTVTPTKRLWPIYQIPMDVLVIFELLLAVYLSTAVIVGWKNRLFDPLPFWILTCAGFFYVGLHNFRGLISSKLSRPFKMTPKFQIENSKV